MALIKCPDCGRDISDKAVKCIHCGYPLNRASNDNNPVCPNQARNGQEQKRLSDAPPTAEPILSTCLYCGAPLQTESNFCGKCGTPQRPINHQNQNYNAAPYPFENPVPVSPYMQNTYVPNGNIPKPRFMALGIIGLVLGAIGLFIYPTVFNVLGLIFGLIAFISNPKEKNEGLKAIWNYKNKARGVGLGALSLNICGIVLMIIHNILLYGIWNILRS